MPVGTAELSTNPEHFLCCHTLTCTHTHTHAPCAFQIGSFMQVMRETAKAFYRLV